MDTMSKSDCGHDPRFRNVFDLPKDCRGCLACFAERKARALTWVWKHYPWMEDLYELLGKEPVDEVA